MTHDAVCVRQLKNLPASHAIQNPNLQRWRANLAVDHREHVAGRSFSHAAVGRTQDGLMG
jgi:hypothetical protein